MKLFKVATLLISLATISACGKPDQEPGVPIEFPPNPVLLKADNVAFNGTRVIFLSGLHTRYEDFLGYAPVSRLMAGLTAHGYQVLLFNYKYTNESFFSQDGGLAYRSYFKSLLQDMLGWADSKHGSAQRTIIGGFSFGGLHSMMGFASMPDRFDGYFALFPLVKFDVLPEFPSLKAEHFDPTNELQALASKPGLISWGDQDWRVDWRLSSQLAQDIQAQGQGFATSHEYQGMGHGLDDRSIDDTLAWIYSL